MMSTAGVTMYDGMGSEMSSQAPPFDSSRTPLVERRVSGMTIANTSACALLRIVVLRRVRTGCSNSRAQRRAFCCTPIWAGRWSVGIRGCCSIASASQASCRAVEPSTGRTLKARSRSRWILCWRRSWQEGMAKPDRSCRIPKEPRESWKSGFAVWLSGKAGEQQPRELQR